MSDTGTESMIGKDVGDLLCARGETVAVAETCTGGHVGSLLTATPGASDYLDRVVVPYDYDALRDLLAVSRETLDDHGAVSEQTATALARAVRDTADTTWGVSTAGVLGPDGAAAETPVGTAFVGVAYAAPWGTGDSDATVARYAFDGDRIDIRTRVAEQALQDLLDVANARPER